MTTDEVYTILVKHAGAAENERGSFLHHAATNMQLEWRFCGLLGFGGKVWRRRDGWAVTCYGEDITPERLRIIDTVNALLKGA